MFVSKPANAHTRTHTHTLIHSRICWKNKESLKFASQCGEKIFVENVHTVQQNSGNTNVHRNVVKSLRTSLCDGVLKSANYQKDVRKIVQLGWR